MARKKKPEDLEWEKIFNAIQFEAEPDPKYIKQAVIETASGKKFRLTGYEFQEVMSMDRNQDPAHAQVISCKITLNFDLIKHDVTRFAVKELAKSARRHAKSSRQQKINRALKKAPQRQTVRKTLT